MNENWGPIKNSTLLIIISNNQVKPIVCTETRIFEIKCINKLETIYQHKWEIARQATKKSTAHFIGTKYQMKSN